MRSTPISLQVCLGLLGVVVATPEELEKRRKKIGKGTVKPIRNRVITKEAEEFLKIIKDSEYSVIQ